MPLKLKAFTLIELLIGLVLSSIAVAMAGTVFIITTQQFKMYKESNNKILDLASLSCMIKMDIDRCDKIQLLGSDGFVLELSDRSIAYKWDAHKLMRISGNTSDTFTVKVNSGSFFHLGESVQTGGIVEQIELTISTYQGQSEKLHFQKMYSGNQLMNSGPDK